MLHYTITHLQYIYAFNYDITYILSSYETVDNRWDVNPGQPFIIDVKFSWESLCRAGQYRLDEQLDSSPSHRGWNLTLGGSDPHCSVISRDLFVQLLALKEGTSAICQYVVFLTANHTRFGQAIGSYLSVSSIV